MNRYLKDPLLLISALLAITGAVQASTGMLSALAEQYPVAFGVAMTAVSAATGVLTALKTYLISQPKRPDDGQESGA